MFHTLITLAYIIPNIYVFLRIRGLLINNSYKLHYTLIYLLLASIYPASNLIHEGDLIFLSGIFTTIADYLLPFYLYLFLFVLFFDILLLINKILGIISPEMMKQTQFKKAVLSVIVFLSAGVVVFGIINFNTIRTSEYQIEIPGKASEIDHLRIAFVADFHLQDQTNIHFVEKFVREIENINPDLMLFGGDIIEGDSENENLIVSEKLIRGISARYGAFAVPGNHEHYSGQDKGSFFYRAGIKVLCDTIIVINNSFNLGGRNDSHFKSRMLIGDLMKYTSDSLPTILVDHRPTEIDLVSRTITDVQFSGHTHNGQLFPINLITNWIYRVSWGHMKISNTHFFVTSGIRLWGPPVRTTGKSEIMVIDIIFTKL